MCMARKGWPVSDMERIELLRELRAKKDKRGKMKNKIKKKKKKKKSKN